MKLVEIARMLRNAPRCGHSIDHPEGTCYILISHTLANIISNCLCETQESFDMSLEEKRNRIKVLQEKLDWATVETLPVLTTDHLRAEEK